MVRTFTAEIIGPAGSGKSTLTGLLRGRDATIRTGLSIWGLPLHLLGASTFSSLPDLLSLFGRRRFSLEDLKLVIQINALRRLLRRESEKGYQALLLDEGGVFGLAKLWAFGNGSAASDSISGMSGLSSQVGRTLDAVIWLDAPDAVLTRRIRERDKPHRTKNLSEAEICEHLARYRAAFERVMVELIQRNQVKVIKFRTDREPLEDIADQILAGARGEF
ncbi:MAG: hypothetical protein AABN95_21450 [Acidobacteriota bacterium]